MTTLTTTRRDMCYCPGCSHGLVLQHIGHAIDTLGLRPHQVCVVSDIGCIGTADQYFACHTLHGLHGRSVTYAEGIKRVRPDLLVLVLMGDGGAGIGTGHLVHAARRGIGIKVMVCNNFNFGMTGGQHSPTTPPLAVTTTTPDGAVEHPLDICGTVAVNGAEHVARYSALDGACRDGILRALQRPGFALVDIWELCTAYFVPSNKIRPQMLHDTARRLGLPFGVLRDRLHPEGPRPQTAAPAVPPTPMQPRQGPRLSWPRRTELRIAGSAGQRIRSAALALGEIVVRGGIYAMQQDDFPITVRRGHSVSDLILSPVPIVYSAVDRPDLLIVLSRDGRARLGSLSALQPSCVVVAADGVELGPTPATVVRISLKDIERQCGARGAALAVLAWAIVRRGWIDAQHLAEAAASHLQSPHGRAQAEAIRQGVALSPHA